MLHFYILHKIKMVLKSRRTSALLSNAGSKKAGTSKPPIRTILICGICCLVSFYTGLMVGMQHEHTEPSDNGDCDCYDGEGKRCLFVCILAATGPFV